MVKESLEGRNVVDVFKESGTLPEVGSSRILQAGENTAPKGFGKQET